MRPLDPSILFDVFLLAVGIALLAGWAPRFRIPFSNAPRQATADVQTADKAGTKVIHAPEDWTNLQQALATERERVEMHKLDAENWRKDVSRWKQNFREVNGELQAEREKAEVYYADATKMEELLQAEREKAALADEIAARLKMHRVGSLTSDPCPLIGQFEAPGDWLARYDALNTPAAEVPKPLAGLGMYCSICGEGGHDTSWHNTPTTPEVSE